MPTVSTLETDNPQAERTDRTLSPASATHSMVRMALRTRESQRLLRGRPKSFDKPAIIGLFGFAERLRVIWDAAKQMDPYAVWWLLRVETALGRTHACIDDDMTEIQERLVTVTEFDIELAAKEPAVRVELNFACPYAYRAARALGSFDHLMVAMLTADRLGLVQQDRRSNPRRRSERAIRRLFAVPFGYHALGLTPDDLRVDSTKAKVAHAAMGAIPTSILNGEKRPVLLPPTQISPAAASAVLP